MKRIFLTLTMVSLMFLVAAFALGLSIGDPGARDVAVQAHVGWHINLAMGALVFCALVHAIALTYFMGTGRWLEETSAAYRLPPAPVAESKALKQRTIPAMAGCLALLIVTGGLGSAADPASPVQFAGWLGMSAATVHLVVAVITLTCNAVVNLWEYQAIHRNGELVELVLAEVRRIRIEKGLPV